MLKGILAVTLWLPDAYKEFRAEGIYFHCKFCRLLYVQAEGIYFRCKFCRLLYVQIYVYSLKFTRYAYVCIFFIKNHFTLKNIYYPVSVRNLTRSCTIPLISFMLLLYIPQKYYVNQRCVFIQHSLLYLFSVPKSKCHVCCCRLASSRIHHFIVGFGY